MSYGALGLVEVLGSCNAGDVAAVKAAVDAVKENPPCAIVAAAVISAPSEETSRLVEEEEEKHHK